jgi:hypothetical protein
MPFDSQDTGLQIKLLEGSISTEILQTGQPQGTLLLVGRSGPFKSIKWGRKMRVQTTFNPGNPNGTQQVIGRTLDPTTFTGEWNDRFLGDGQAQALRSLFERIHDAGVSVQVTWGGSLSGEPSAPVLAGDPYVRVGIMTSFVPTTDRVQDVPWEATFDWRSAGESAAPPIAATGKLNPSEGFGALTDELDLATATWTAVSQGPQFAAGLPQVALDAMSNAFTSISTATDTIANATAAVTSTVVIPTQAALQLIGACQTGLQSIATMESTLLNVNQLLLEVQDSALDLLRLKDQVLTTLQVWLGAKGACVDASDGMQQYVESDVIAEVRAPAGTDLRDLAIRFYGDADLWFAIARANGIDGSAVPSPPGGPSDDPARPIRIPRPQPGSSSDLRQQC